MGFAHHLNTIQVPQLDISGDSVHQKQVRGRRDSRSTTFTPDIASKQTNPSQSAHARDTSFNQSRENPATEIGKYDDGMAGPFSAVVTAFTIESYQWLIEDLADVTVVLLMQISMQFGNGTSQPSAFEADASSIRINYFLFLSSVSSLTSALFGLLCKQWL
ncbi:hypothetical protein WG66_000254, partial [Moniliophthora roreri]